MEAIWREINKLGDRLHRSEISLATHLGECSQRHMDVVRRLEESSRDRGQLRVDMVSSAAETRRTIGRAQVWVISLLLTVIGSIIAFAASLAMQVIKVS